MELKLSTRENIAAAVRAELARNNHSRNELAKVLNLSLPTTHRSLKGNREFTISELEKISQWLGIPLMALLEQVTS